jgi:hypothetical protein
LYFNCIPSSLRLFPFPSAHDHGIPHHDHEYGFSDFILYPFAFILSDLAVLYGITVGRLNEAVKRNRDRFPADFMFQLTAEEFSSLRSQIATSNLKSQIAISSYDWCGRRHPPFAFTEQGVSDSLNWRLLR